MTCHPLRKMVLSERPYPCIVWEERRPTTIRYLKSNADHGKKATVSQVQNFCFICHTAAAESIQIKYSLINDVWDEHDNMRDGRESRPLSAFPKATIPSMNIVRPRKSAQRQEEIFGLKQRPNRFPEDSDDDDDDDDRWRVWCGESYTEQDLRGTLEIIWKCAQCIAVYPDGIAYPSAKYLMRRLPCWLRDYFPTSMAASKTLPAGSLARSSGPPSDRITTVEFHYRPARTLAEWKKIYRRSRGDFGKVYNLHDIPWYRDGYSWVSSDSEEYVDV
jgi:hypothetical protein